MAQTAATVRLTGEDADITEEATGTDRNDAIANALKKLMEGRDLFEGDVITIVKA